MAVELSFVLITPYSLMKSRTGGIIARLLSRTDLDLVGAQMLTPSKEFAETYAASMRKHVGKRDEFAAKLFSDYMLDNLSPLPDGSRERVLMLLFKGEDACAKLSAVVGQLPNAKNRKTNIIGETIRDTYADLVFNRDGSLNYFEPAVFTPPLYDACQERLGMLADFAEASENIVTNTTHQEPNSERTLVIIKPDNWRCPSVKPGNIIDMLSRTGLRIVGCKIYQMSVAEALEFYGPVQNALRKKLAPVIGKKAYDKLSEEFGLKFHPDSEQMLTESIGRDYADDQFNKIVEFMSGRRPDECPTEELNRPGKVKCMILIYEGPDAVRKIRDVLGPTDPTKAPGGTIRREFGHDVMVNTAHASDSKESFERETKIIKIQNNPMAAIIRAHLASMKQ
ncbi:MAG: nucleoside-diphosphate kinase [Victivallales bacterium]